MHEPGRVRVSFPAQAGEVRRIAIPGPVSSHELFPSYASLFMGFKCLFVLECLAARAGKLWGECLARVPAPRALVFGLGASRLVVRVRLLVLEHPPALAFEIPGGNRAHLPSPPVNAFRLFLQICVVS